MQLDSLKDWIGRHESSVDHVTIPFVQRLAATLDRDDPLPKHGDVLPYGWHMLMFPRVVRQSQLGPDGHPARGDFLPPVPLPRRMFAGRRIDFHGDLRVGDEVRRDASIKDVTIKPGRSGEMVFVTLRIDLSTARGPALTEEHDVVYRPDPPAASAAASSGAAKPPPPAPGQAVWKKTLTPDAVMLFRMSALAFNGHRIHSDYQYVTQVEHYPNLVVPGSLHTLVMFELARERGNERGHAPRYKRIAWRNMKPLFVDRPFTACGEPAADGKSAKLWVVDNEGGLALSATAEFE